MPRVEYMDGFHQKVINVLCIKSCDYESNNEHSQKPKKMQQKFEKNVSKTFKPKSFL